jgi:hypothetical protein
MKAALIAAALSLAWLGASEAAYAAGSAATSSVTGTGASFQGQAQAVLPGQTVTLNIGGGQPPSIIQSTNTAPAGTASTSGSASLSVGAVVGGGFGSTSGVTSTLNGAVPISPTTTLTPATLGNTAHLNGSVGF